MFEPLKPAGEGCGPLSQLWLESLWEWPHHQTTHIPSTVKTSVCSSYPAKLYKQVSYANKIAGNLHYIVAEETETAL